MGEKLTPGEKAGIAAIIVGIAAAPLTGGASLLASITGALGAAVAASQAEDKDC